MGLPSPASTGAKMAIPMPHDTPTLQARLDALERANRAKDQYLALLSHELRNHIHAIRTNVWLIKARNRVSDVVRPSEAIDRQVVRLAHLVDELMESMHAADKGNLEFGEAVLQQVVRAAVESAQAVHDVHRRELTVDLPERPIYVSADAPRLQHALGRLLDNAIRYTPQQGAIVISARREAGEVLVSVKDEGCGIPPGELAGLFDRFEARNGAPPPAGAGLGIGLHVARELIEAHGGTIVARSDGPGRGAEFIVRLPTIEGEDEAQFGPDPVAEAPDEGLRILVVDDNHDAADSLAEVLQAYGHRVRTAYGGEEAVQVAKDGGVNVALVDIGMPSVDGFEVAERISAAPAARDTLLVAVTGWGEKADRERSRQAGFAYHLTKPVDYDALASLLSTASRRTESRA